MSKEKRAVRTNLTQAEWLRMKIAATTRGVTIEQFASDALRAVLKGAKP